MASWQGLAQCKKCPHKQACDYRLPLGQVPNPLCPDGWVEGPNPAHMIPGPDYRPPSEMGKYTGRTRQERETTAQYSLRHFCLMCACWENAHTPVTNSARTWLCQRHVQILQKWKRKRSSPILPPRPSAAKRLAAQREAKRQVVLGALADGPRSLREIANALEWSVELCRFHLNKLARASKVRKIDMRRGQSWIAWQLVTAKSAHGQDRL